jgi:hypothetical protein
VPHYLLPDIVPQQYIKVLILLLLLLLLLVAYWEPAAAARPTHLT